MKENTLDLFEFTPVRGKKVTAQFEDMQLSSDGGLLLAAEVERSLGLFDRLADCIRDERESGKIRHRLGTMLRQRVLQICAGYEDADDCDHLRHDPLFQTAAGRLSAETCFRASCCRSNVPPRVNPAAAGPRALKIRGDGGACPKKVKPPGFAGREPQSEPRTVNMKQKTPRTPPQRGLHE